MQISILDTCTFPVDLSSTLEAIALCHEQAPVAGQMVLGVTGHHPEECEYEICAPQDVGMALDALRSFLTGAQDTPGAELAPSYVHPYFEGEEQTATGAFSTLFAEDLATPDFAANPTGLRASPRDAEYLLVAKNGQGEAAGYIQFRVSFFPELDDAPTAGLERHAGLVVTLDRIFVRQAERGVGVGTALLEKVGFVMWAELRGIASQVRSRPAAPESPVVLHPYVMSTWYSWAGKMAHYRLVDLVTQYRDAASDDFSTPSFRLADVCEHGQY
jgi:GNAT superfamily N-acetyltransferase